MILNNTNKIIDFKDVDGKDFLVAYTGLKSLVYAENIRNSGFSVHLLLLDNNLDTQKIIELGFKYFRFEDLNLNEYDVIILDKTSKEDFLYFKTNMQKENLGKEILIFSNMNSGYFESDFSDLNKIIFFEVLEDSELLRNNFKLSLENKIIIDKRHQNISIVSLIIKIFLGINTQIIFIDKNNYLEFSVQINESIKQSFLHGLENLIHYENSNDLIKSVLLKTFSNLENMNTQLNYIYNDLSEESIIGFFKSISK